MKKWKEYGADVWRMEVPSGHLYHTSIGLTRQVTFIPEPDATFRYREAVGPVSQTWQISTPVAPDPKLEAIATAAARFKDMFEEFGKSVVDLETPELKRLFEAVDDWFYESEESENDY